MTQDTDYHSLRLGRLVSNLQSLEFALRAFLLAATDPENATSKFNYHQLRVGDRVPKNAFTNWDTLRELLEKYNTEVEPHHPDLCIDDSVVTLRDALAHGRVSTAEPSLPLKLLKFSQPDQGEVEVTYAARMDEPWFSEQIDLVGDQLRKVLRAARLRGLSAFPRAGTD